MSCWNAEKRIEKAFLKLVGSLKELKIKFSQFPN
jgi:hypothetical protein